MSETENKETVQLQAGKKVPSLTGVKWVKGEEALLGEKLTVLIFLNESAEYYSVISAMAEMAKKYKKKVSIAGLSSMNEENMNYFLSGTEETIQYGVGTVSEKLYIAYMSGIEESAYAFVIDSEKHLLWGGDFQSMDTALAVVFKKKDEKILLELGKKRQKILELNSEIHGNISKHPEEKKEIKTLISEYLEFFADDDDRIENLKALYSPWTPGETAEIPEQIDWISEKSDFSHPFTLVSFWDMETAPSVMPFYDINEIFNEHKDSLNVIGIVKKAESKAEIQEYLDGLGIENIYPNGIISAKNFAKFFPEGSADYDSVFLIGRDSLLLWKGSTYEVKIIISYIKNNSKNADSRLLEFQSDKEIFSAVSDSVNSGTELTAKILSKLRKYGKKIMEVNPDNLNVIQTILDFSGRLGSEELKNSFVDIDISDLRGTSITDAVSILSDLTDDIYPFENVFQWLETAVKKDQTSEACCAYGTALARAGLTQKAMDCFEKALEISSGEDASAQTGKKEMIRILEGQKAVRKVSQTVKS
ncbi:MAG TPA: hypothetical protein PK453_13645 [Leptospiraceae bacterium]|nr:hypothetical protein [Leptospiraceae bacterium]HNF24529.1 hypothetical protein [Leptospiraceae bacterium]HNI98232.1 hypothetical protein [Leptospiraceae bacterium]HNM03450.1 hypothetical protein [Leptospiraceae bacterium]